MQHRHEDRHAVYVAGCNNGINAQHRHEDRHGVYVEGIRADNDAEHRHEHAVYVLNEDTLQNGRRISYNCS